MKLKCFCNHLQKLHFALSFFLYLSYLPYIFTTSLATICKRMVKKKLDLPYQVCTYMLQSFGAKPVY